MIIVTLHTSYVLTARADGTYDIIGHHTYCPRLTHCKLPYGLPAVGHVLTFRLLEGVRRDEDVRTTAVIFVDMS